MRQNLRSLPSNQAARLAFASHSVCRREGRCRGTRKPREKGVEEELDETRWRTVEGKGTNAVGGSWRRNDYRPRMHSLPAIISSTNATKSIGVKSPKIFSCTDPLLNINSLHFFTYAMIIYYLNSNAIYIFNSRVTRCRQKFQLVYMLIDIVFFIKSLIVRFHTDP